MNDEIRYQRKCLYASAEYANSFWGKYICLYQGEGGLRLTGRSLCLEDCPGAVEIPFPAIKGVGLSRFSALSKPFGLSRLTVTYSTDDDFELRTIHLVPFDSASDPTPVTSRVVASWLETLGQVQELTNRVQPAPIGPEPPQRSGSGVMVAAIFVLPLMVMGVLWWLS